MTERRNIAATSRARYRYKACGRKMGNGRMDVRFGQEEEKEGICVQCDGLTTLTLPAWNYVLEAWHSSTCQRVIKANTERRSMGCMRIHNWASDRVFFFSSSFFWPGFTLTAHYVRSRHRQSRTRINENDDGGTVKCYGSIRSNLDCVSCFGGRSACPPIIDLLQHIQCRAWGSVPAAMQGAFQDMWLSWFRL